LTPTNPTLFIAEARSDQRYAPGDSRTIDNSIGYAIVYVMKTTITIDQAGRVVIPKSMRDRMHLEGGSRLCIELLGERIQLSRHADDVRIEKRGKRRVVVGGKRFDAGMAVLEAREEQIERLAAKHRKS
jgi:AbrB family looped-hinge helix DNA binding protein